MVAVTYNYAHTKVHISTHSKLNKGTCWTEKNCTYEDKSIWKKEQNYDLMIFNYTENKPCNKWIAFEINTVSKT